METITIHPKSKQQARLFEQLAKALNVPFKRRKKALMTRCLWIKLRERKKILKRESLLSRKLKIYGSSF